MVEVAEELVEAVHRRQVLVEITQVVLAELSCRIAARLEQLCDGRVLRLQADRRGGNADLRETGTKDALTRDERGTPSGAALLAVGVGEAHALRRETVDVGRAVTHQAAAVGADIRDADIVAPDDEDVGL